jgi:aminopeptidase-like protein
MGEPQRGRRGLLPSVGGKAAQADHLAMLLVLNLSDGDSVLDIAERSGLTFDKILRAIEALTGCCLLRQATAVGASRREARISIGSH